jgi:hypothetical protein
MTTYKSHTIKWEQSYTYRNMLHILIRFRFIPLQNPRGRIIEGPDGRAENTVFEVKI